MLALGLTNELTALITQQRNFIPVLLLVVSAGPTWLSGGLDGAGTSACPPGSQRHLGQRPQGSQWGGFLPSAELGQTQEHVPLGRLDYVQHEEASQPPKTSFPSLLSRYEL